MPSVRAERPGALELLIAGRTSRSRARRRAWRSGRRWRIRRRRRDDEHVLAGAARPWSPASPGRHVGEDEDGGVSYFTWDGSGSTLSARTPPMSGEAVFRGVLAEDAVPQTQRLSWPAAAESRQRSQVSSGSPPARSPTFTPWAAVPTSRSPAMSEAGSEGSGRLEAPECRARGRRKGRAWFGARRLDAHQDFSFGLILGSGTRRTRAGRATELRKRKRFTR